MNWNEESKNEIRGISSQNVLNEDIIGIVQKEEKNVKFTLEMLVDQWRKMK